MRNIKYLCIVGLVIICGCGPNKNPLKKDNSKKESSIYTIQDMKGVWAENPDENASFRISSDTMFLLEGDFVKFTINQDTLITFYDGLTTKDKIIKLASDSLTLVNQLGDTIELCRRNTNR